MCAVGAGIARAQLPSHDAANRQRRENLDAANRQRRENLEMPHLQAGLFRAFGVSLV